MTTQAELGYDASEKISHLVWNLKPGKGIELRMISAIEVLATLAGMNQGDLARAMGIPDSQLSEYLSGTRKIGPTAIQQFAKALKVPPEVLLASEKLSPEQMRESILGQMQEAAAPDPQQDRPLSLPHSALIDKGPLVRLPYWEIRAGSKAELFDLEPKGYRRVARSDIPGDPDEFFVLEVKGQSMANPARANIQEGTRLLMHRRNPKHMDVVAARIEGETTLKRLHVRSGIYYLVAEPGPDEKPYADMKCHKDTVFEGVAVLKMDVSEIGPGK